MMMVNMLQHASCADVRVDGGAVVWLEHEFNNVAQNNNNIVLLIDIFKSSIAIWSLIIMHHLHQGANHMDTKINPYDQGDTLPQLYFTFLHNDGRL